MPWPYDSEVPAIHSGNLHDLKALGDGHDGSIGATESKAGVLLGQLGQPAPVRQGELSQLQVAGLKGQQEPRLGSGACSLTEEKADLRYHRRRDH